MTDKNIKKPNKYNAKRALVYKVLAERHEVSVQFVRLAVHGERDSETAEAIKKEYNQLMAKVDQVLS